MPSDVPDSPPSPAPEAQLALVRAAFDAFARRDLAALQELCAADVRFVSQTARVGGAGEDYRGHQGLRYYFGDTEDVWETLTLTPEVVRAHDGDPDVVIVTGRVQAWGSGRVVDGSASWLFRVRDGLISEIRSYDRPGAADAAAAAGG
jgi:ketosteroid isomerase-like protein